MLIGDEPRLPYQRPPLSKDYLDGKIGLDLLADAARGLLPDHRIDYVCGDPRSTEIDRAGQQPCGSRSGERLGYDHLVLATGARNRVPPLPGIELDGVCYLRDLAETDDLRERLAAAEHVVVIGAGFIGLEFAAIARAEGKPVHIVELIDRVMGRVVCPDTSAYFAEAHRDDRGRVQLWRAASTGSAARAARSPCRAGRRPHAAGRPRRRQHRRRAERGAGRRGRASRSRTASSSTSSLLTADPAISAIGDCASFPSRHSRKNPVRLEAVQNAADHARCVADRLIGKPHAYTRAAVVLERAGRRCGCRSPG